MEQSRREFLVGAAAVGLTPTFNSGPEVYQGPIIDTHQHLWDFRKFRPPWLAGEGPKINRSFTVADYAKATAKLNLAKTVYMEVDVAVRQQSEEAEYVIGLSKDAKTKMAAAVISSRPSKPGFAEYVNKFKDSPYIKGVRQVLQTPETPKGYCLKPDFIRDIQLLGDLGLSFDICIRPEELPDGIRLADACPYTRFILDHCGNASARNPHQKQWERDITEFGKRKNVVCKVSGIIKTVKPDWDAVHELDASVKHVLHSFGPERVMFGGDWPVCNNTSSIYGWVDTVSKIMRNSSDLDKSRLFHDNAANFYGIA